MIIVEIGARTLFPPKAEPNYLEGIRDTVLTPERLWAPNLNVEYDIRGLYKGADKSHLHTSAQRLIEPQPVGDHPFKVLFIGGSTTESLYVEEDRRWVALLSKTGDLAAYNAGQSGANTVDAYYGYQDLIKKGLKFDLVVLMTAINDYGWDHRLTTALGRHLSKDGYHEALQKYYLLAHEGPLSIPQLLLERCSSYSKVCVYLKRAKKSWADRNIINKASKQIAVGQKSKDKKIGTVTANYLIYAPNPNNPHPVKKYEVSEVRDSVDSHLSVYKSVALANIGDLHR